jgi:glycosyltransferase involved in cell wall biosynthesis
MKQALFIPIYQPSEKVLPFLAQFKNGDFERMIVVDDGSGVNYQNLFRSKRATRFEVISYPTNGGKGHALKTAIRYLIDHCPEIQGIVTADGDGQHAYADILKVRDSSTPIRPRSSWASAISLARTCRIITRLAITSPPFTSRWRPTLNSAIPKPVCGASPRISSPSCGE